MSSTRMISWSMLDYPDAIWQALGDVLGCPGNDCSGMPPVRVDMTFHYRSVRPSSQSSLLLFGSSWKKSCNISSIDEVARPKGFELRGRAGR